MIEFYVSNQTLTLYTPVVAADALHYLTGVVHFTDDEWEGYAKWLHFARTEENEDPVVYDIALTGDAFDETAELNLTAGEWLVYLTGTLDNARLTSVPVVLTVKPSGLRDVPLHGLPQSVAEQIDGKASEALELAQAVSEAAAAGEFNGADGRSFVILGYYDTAEDLEEAVTEPAAGDAYAVGTEAPYDIYIWDGVGSEWVNMGEIQGATGETGADGTTFTPAVDEYGNISWTNDGGKTNPATQNIRGPKGDPGDDGANGMSPLTAAQNYGYEGTEATLYMALAQLPAHAARHLPTGADPLHIKTDNVDDAQVTRPKLGTDAVTSLYTSTITTDWTPSAVQASQALSPDGESASFAINTSPSTINGVMEVASGEYVSPNDYTYSAGTLTFNTTPPAGTNAYIVFFPHEGAPYMQEITVSGILETDRVLIDAVLPDTLDDSEEIENAWAYIYKITVTDDTLLFYSREELETAIPIRILAVSR